MTKRHIKPDTTSVMIIALSTCNHREFQLNVFLSIVIISSIISDNNLLDDRFCLTSDFVRKIIDLPFLFFFISVHFLRYNPNLSVSLYTLAVFVTRHAPSTRSSTDRRYSLLLLRNVYVTYTYATRTSAVR